MKRTLPALKLHKSPLVMVLAQVRISPIVKMQLFVEDIQERLRQQGFPRFEQGVTHEIILQGLQPEVRPTPRWEFQNKDRSSGIILTTSSIVLHTNRYETFAQFSASLRLALQVVNETAHPGLVERLGLRYVDLIRPGPDESWTDYLQDGLHGLSAQRVGMETSLQRHEIVGGTKVGSLVVRCGQTVDGAFLPPDLVPTSLLYADLKAAPGEVFTILDLDHYSEAARDFEIDPVMTVMEELHDNLDLSFREATTEHARKTWEAQKL